MISVYQLLLWMVSILASDLYFLWFRLETFTFWECMIEATNQAFSATSFSYVNVLCSRTIFPLTCNLFYFTVPNEDSPTKSVLDLYSIPIVKHLLLCWPHSQFVSSSIFGSVAVTLWNLGRDWSESGCNIRQEVEHPVLQIWNTYLNILITSKFYILARCTKYEYITFYNLSVYHYNLHDKQSCIITGYEIK
jgi:hypothetical protein